MSIGLSTSSHSYDRNLTHPPRGSKSDPINVFGHHTSDNMRVGPAVELREAIAAADEGFRYVFLFLF
jgi:hypothetical protein